MTLQCRSCLKRNPLEFVDMESKFLPELTKENYYAIFNYFTRLEASPDDLLPKVLCDSCVRELQSAFQFVRDAKRANVVLLESLRIANQEDQENGSRLPTGSITSSNDGRTFTLTGALVGADNEINVLEETIVECEEEFLDDGEQEAIYILEETTMQSVATSGELLSKIDHSTADELYADDLLDDEYLIEYTDDDGTLIGKDSESFGKKWKCIECKRVLRGDVSYVGHMNWHKGIRPYKCNHCELSFRCKKSLARHNKLRHLNSQEPECTGNSAENIIEVCESYNNFTEDHLAQQDSSDISTVTLEEQETLQNHETVTCTLCHKELMKSNLARHIESHRKKDSQEFRCSFCSRVCKSRQSLGQHEKVHKETASDVTYICTDCDRPYKTKSLLAQHRKQAHKERDNICPLCGNAFKLKNQLSNHMKLHLEKNIKCTLCDKKYARSVDLDVHMRTHTGEMPFCCHICNRRFAIKVRLTYHLQKHYGIKHICKECNAEFNSRQKLKAHSYKHTGMPYRCARCNDRGFANRDVFKRHLQRVHSTSMSDEELCEMFQRNTGKAARVRTIEELDSLIVRTDDSIEDPIITTGMELVDQSGEES